MRADVYRGFEERHKRAKKKKKKKKKNVDLSCCSRHHFNSGKRIKMAASSTTNDNNNRVESYIGSFISLISKSDIRYEGVLSHLSVSDSTLALTNVRSYGSEGRKKDGPQIPPSDILYEYVLFRGTDIKDLQVKPMLSASRDEHVYSDPAIIQFAGVPSSSSISSSFGFKIFTESVQGLNSPALASGATHPFPSYQSSNDGGTGLSQATKNAGPSFSAPSYLQGLDGTFSDSSFSLQYSSMVSSPLPVQNQMQLQGVEDAPPLGLINPSEFVSHVLPATSDSIQPNFQSFVNPVQFSTSQNSFQTPNILTKSTQETSVTIPQSISKGISNPPIMQPTQFVPCPPPSHDGSITSPLLTPTPSQLSPHQLADFRPDVHSSTLVVFPDQNDVSALTSLSSTSLHWSSGQAMQPPLLPLPNSSHQYTEEFDFEAMNEKFKKDELWDCLGKAKQLTKGTEENGNDQSLGDKEAGGLVSTIDAKPAYNKDNFFDNISCNSLNRSWNGQNRFPERMKQDTENFGIFRQNPNLGYGGFGTGRGNYYHQGHSWGRGYDRGQGGRGRGNITF